MISHDYAAARAEFELDRNSKTMTAPMLRVESHFDEAVRSVNQFKKKLGASKPKKKL